MGKKSKEWQFQSFEGSTKQGRHLRITLEMMQSKAWQELSNNAIRVYLEMKIKYNGNNAENISLTYAEGKKLMAKETFTKAMDQLIDLGFIKLVRQSWTSRECNIYAFSDAWKVYGTDNFKVETRQKRKPKATP